MKLQLLLSVYLYSLNLVKNILLAGFVILNITKVSIEAVSQNVRFTPLPDWIIATKPGGTPPSSREFSDGYFLSFVDQQVNLDLQADFFRTVRNIESESGVSNGSEVSVVFDPVYERIEFHRVAIIRNNQTITNVDASGFTIVPVENDRQRFLYNGTYQASVVLKDVRKGDRIEVAYSKIGRNPVLKGKFSAFLSFGALDYIQHIHRTIISSSGRTLYFKNFGSVPQRKEFNRGGRKVYQWELKNVKNRPYEDYMPSWVDKEPFVQVSEYKSWAEVVSWGLEYYSNPVLSPDLASKVRQLKEEADTSELAYINTAVRFVQDEIRYLGIETGEHSHKPHDPGVVYSQRFGDCKDKTFLLCAILRANQIEAYPVLVDTYQKTSVNGYLPSPIDFNHVICRIAVVTDAANNPEKKENLFVDPTLSLQGGSVQNMYFPGYGKGLLLRQGETALTEVPARNAGSIFIKEELLIAQKGSSSEKGELMVWTDFREGEADNMRSSFQSGKLSQIEENYLNYYRDVFPNSEIELMDSLEFFDDRESKNEFTVMEHYHVDNQWYYEDARQTHVVRIRPQIFADRLIVMPKRSREYPVELKYPFKLVQEENVRLPAGVWQIKNENFKIERDSYRLSYQSDFDARTNSWTLRYEYETLKDHVPVAEVEQFRKDITRITDHTDYELSEPGIARPSFNWDKKVNGWMILAWLLAIGAGAMLSRRLYFNNAGNEVSGYAIPIGGWLILLSINTVLSPIIYFSQSLISPESFFFFTWDTAEAFNEEGVLYLVAGIGSMIANAMLFCGSILLVILLLQKRSTFPVVYIGLVWISFFIHVVVLALFQSVKGGEYFLHNGGSQLTGRLLGAVIWTMYLQKSARVRKTFVQNYGQKPFVAEPGNGYDENLPE